jgi:exopolysaccharide biosynthesis protein
VVLLGSGQLPATPAGPNQVREPAGWAGRLRWTQRRVVAGVVLRHGVLRDPQAAPYWTVTIDAVTRSSITGQYADAELGTRRWAARTAARLRADGYRPRVRAFDWAGYSDTPRGLEGVRVRVGHFGSAGAARAEVNGLAGRGFPTAAVEWTGMDQDQAPDAEQVHEVIISPRAYRGTLEVSQDGPVASEHTASEVAAVRRATVVTNGGFFVVSPAEGYPGASAGLAVYGGALESMSAGARGALVLGAGRPRIEHLVSTVTVRVGGGTRAVQGINRLPGVIVDCGRPGDRPSSQPRQDVACTSASELVLFTGRLGANVPAGPGTQVNVGPGGRVRYAGERRGGRVPAGGCVLEGIGSLGRWLRRHAAAGRRVVLRERVADRRGQPLTLRRGVSVASGGPVLLADGKPTIDAVAEGDIVPADLSFNYAWAQQRQPRTLAGVSRSGQLILATIDGRQPGYSEGATLVEAAALMRSLGAVSALNLDGGGSTTLVVRGALENRPSDGAERAVGNFVLARPLFPR